MARTRLVTVSVGTMSHKVAAEAVHYPEANLATPDGLVHAYDEGSATTLCGLPLRNLHAREFSDVSFDSLTAQLQCAGCIEGGALAHG